MRRTLFSAVLMCGLALSILTSRASAQTNTPRRTSSPSPTIETATPTAQLATGSAAISSPSAEVQQRIKDVKDADITAPEGKQKDKLTSIVEENNPGSLSWNNGLQLAIRNAVKEGVPPNIIVLVLLFPLIASFIAGSKHVIGLRGFGLYIPAVLSVALVSTGIVEGLAMFLAIVTTALITKRVLRKTKLSYLPRTALLLWTISLGIFGVLVVAPFFNLVTLMSVNIFPILILVLLAENFLDAQSKTKQADAIALTIETLALAIISGSILKWEPMQRFALTQPELLIVITASLNFIIGRFSGLRITEWLRFRTIIEEE